MGENYSHFIITRFNLKLKVWGKDKFDKDVLTDEWMRVRMKIFTTYCLPSVVKQTSLDFKWIIYLGSDTSSEFRDQFDELTQKYNFIMTVYEDSYELFQEKHCHLITKLCRDNNKEFAITTRLDNDDILHQDFIKTVQDKFEKQEYLAINFVKILMINPNDLRSLNMDYQFSNHFISLIEKIPAEEIIKGCYSKRDVEWDVEGKVLHIADQPYCIETIGDTNLYNHFRGFPVLRIMKLDEFQLGNSEYSNKFFDIKLIRFWKMSWLKYFRYLIKY